VTDYFRARIEKIIYDALDYDDEDVTLSRHLSEVLVRELGLRQEWGALDEEDSGILYDDLAEVKVSSGEVLKVRHITDWNIVTPSS
jgi:hypothetical protein